MRKWRSHKVVEADLITRVVIDDHSDHRASTGRVTVLGDETVEVPGGFFARSKPMPGDYLVRYTDGYLSWSPPAAFESGYTEVEPSAFELWASVRAAGMAGP